MLKYTFAVNSGTLSIVSYFLKFDFDFPPGPSPLSEYYQSSAPCRISKKASLRVALLVNPAIYQPWYIYIIHSWLAGQNGRRSIGDSVNHLHGTYIRWYLRI